MTTVRMLALGASAMLLIGACGGATPATRNDAGPARKFASTAPQAAVPRNGDAVRLSDGTTTLFWGETDVRGVTSGRLEIEDAGSARYYFSPTILIGSPKQTLTLEIVNRTATGHPFTISSKHVDVAPGQRSRITVRFPAAGALTFSCPHGHAGELRVA